MRNRTRGRFVLSGRVSSSLGGGIHAPEHHSDSPESIFAHTPGLRVVIPSSPAKAYGLLLAAIRNPDPVIFFEPKRLYRMLKQVVQDTGEALPLDTAFVVRPGNDLTLITWGALVHDTLQLADQLYQNAGINAEVIDVATVSPLDFDTIYGSVEKRAVA